MEPELCLLLRARHVGPQDSGLSVCTPLGPGAWGMVVCKGESSGCGRFKQVEGRSTELPGDSARRGERSSALLRRDGCPGRGDHIFKSL